MANLCITEYIIYSEDKNDINRITNALKDDTSIYLNDFLSKFDIYDSSIYQRGTIFDWLQVYENTIYIKVESAWNGCHDVFNIINEKIFNNKLEISYKEEEPGFVIFNIYDPYDRYDKNLCYVCVNNFHEDIKDDEDTRIRDAIDRWYNYINPKPKYFYNLSTREQIDFINSYKYDNENTMYSIFEYNYISDNVINDSVNHPKHYTSHPSGVECIEITRHHCFSIGNCIKYLWRAGLKDDSNLSIKDKEIEDLQKIIWYIDDRINNLPNLTCNETYDDANFEHPSKINLSIITEHYTNNVATAMNALFRTGLSTTTYTSNELSYLNKAKTEINNRIIELSNN